MSEFGTGLCYCLGLFLAHAERYTGMKRNYEKLAKDRPDLFTPEEAVRSWFNGAGDHIVDMAAESAPTDELRRRAGAFKSFVLARRFYYEHVDAAIKDEDVWWSLNEAMSILLEIDKAHGVEAEEAEWK